VAPSRRGAAFGAILAAFDTGIGAGASFMGGLVQAYSYRLAFLAAAVIAGMALPWFLAAERRLRFRTI
jgi:predicted MFS family arabinose efflux permease